MRNLTQLEYFINNHCPEYLNILHESTITDALRYVRNIAACYQRHDLIEVIDMVEKVMI